MATAILSSIYVCALENDSISFRYSGHLIIRSTINDTTKCNVIYDTGGADLFGVDSVFLKHSNWVPLKLGSALAGGGAGKKTIPIILDQTKVRFGNIKETYDIVPIFQLRDIVDCHIDGIWGIKNIANHPFEINFEHSFLKQHKTRKPCVDSYKRLPIKYEDNRILVQAETSVGGTIIKGWYLMDTGGDGSVVFTAHTAKEYKLDALSGRRYIIDISQFGIGDKEQEALVEMMSDRIVIGTDTIREESINYTPEGTGAFSDRNYLGVIGNAVWSKFNIIIDAKKGMLYLQRFKADTPEGTTYDYNFRNRTDICPGWIVSSLTRGGDAVGAGIELGDIITSVNGRPVTEYSWEEEDNIMDITQQTLELIGKDGKTKQVTLEAKERWK